VRAFDVAVGLGAPGADVGVAGAERFDCGAEVALEFVAVVGEDALQAPAGVAQRARDASREAAGLGLVGPGTAPGTHGARVRGSGRGGAGDPAQPGHERRAAGAQHSAVGRREVSAEVRYASETIVSAGRLD
jgi:hypothetical protein